MNAALRNPAKINQAVLGEHWADAVSHLPQIPDAAICDGDWVVAVVTNRPRGEELAPVRDLRARAAMQRSA